MEQSECASTSEVSSKQNVLQGVTVALQGSTD